MDWAPLVMRLDLVRSYLAYVIMGEASKESQRRRTIEAAGPKWYQEVAHV